MRSASPPWPLRNPLSLGGADNEGDKPKSIGVEFAKLGWSATTKATVRDLWAHKDLPAATGSVANTTIKPHGSQLLLLTEAKEGH